MRENDRQRINAQNLDFSRQGLRVLTFVYKKMGEKEILTEKSESGYIFLGMTAMMDPPRPESKNAVLNARRAGIRPVMITGDHKITAAAIAEKIGILNEGGIAVSGPEPVSYTHLDVYKRQSIRRYSDLTIARWNW